MAASRLVQTRIPPALFQIIAKRAKAEGLSLAAYVRRLIMLQVNNQEKN
jgi:predicted HicB family RNase H-like nuclease